MKTSIWKRFLSLLLVIALIVPTLLNVVPELMLDVYAAPVAVPEGWVDVGSLKAGEPGMLVSGIYEIYVPNTNMMLASKTTVDNRALYVVDKNTSGLDGSYMRWIIEYGGESTATSSEGNITRTGHWYTIRHLASGRWVNMGGSDAANYFHKTYGTYDAESKWQILYNPSTGNYSIRNWAQVFEYGYDVAYVVPVERVDASVSYTKVVKDQDLSTGENLVGATTDAFEYDIRRVPIQNYGDAQLSYGTYRVTNGTYTLRANPNAAYVTEPQWPYPDGHDFTTSANSLAATGTTQTDGTQLFMIDWTSDGYITIADAAKGRYVGSRMEYMTAFGEAIAELVDNPGTSFDERSRFFWIPIPVYSGITRQANQFYLCNVLTGQRMYMNTSSTINFGYPITGNKLTVNGSVTNYAPTAWTFTLQSSATVKGENPNQGYNGSTGVYVDSFDHSDTIRLPIKIYDYLNDGLLFEYAQSNSKGTPVYNSAGTSVLGYTGKQVIDGKTYIMGNNTVFTFQSGSRGGTGWVGNTNGYTNYQGTATNYYGESAWNTYKSFHLGRVWSVQGSTAKWYTSGSSPTKNNFGGSNVDYNWESYGLGGFRFWSPVTYGKDLATIYYIAGATNVEQGIWKDSVASISGTYPMFSTLMFSGNVLGNQTTNNALTYDGFRYKLFGQIEGHATLGLVQSSLNPQTNAPEYRDIVVEYLAYMLQQTLSVPQSQDGVYAYNYVLGTAHDRYGNGRDLAEWLRARIIRGENGAMGSYQDTINKLNNGTLNPDGQPYKLVGTWDECKQSIRTFCDAAYYLLNNLFVPNSYNEPQNMFNYLELTKVKADGENGEIRDVYVFDSGLTTGGSSYSGSDTAVYYDTVNKVIKNTHVTGKASAFLNTNDTTPVCAHPFLPIWETFDMATQTGTQDATKSPYLVDDGVTGGADDVNTYYNRNYNYVMAMNGEFVYHEDDALFFDFEGDDDVYLYINGQLVLDMGGAHAITGYDIALNDYVYNARAILQGLSGYYSGMSDADFNGLISTLSASEQGAYTRARALDLQEGEVYSIDFYYMERHGWGSNLRIATNIRVSEPGLRADKSAYQNDVEIDYGGVVDGAQPVEYSFAMTNTGNTKLYNLTLVDNSIGLSLIPYGKAGEGFDDVTAYGLVIADRDGTTTAIDAQVCDRNGNSLEVSDLVFYLTNYTTDAGGNRVPSDPIVLTFDNNEELARFLHDCYTETHQTGEAGDAVENEKWGGDGLWADSTLTVRGIYYRLTEEQKNDGVFNNTLLVTATPAHEKDTDKLSGIDSHRVYVPADPMFYQWRDHTLTVVTLDLLKAFQEASVDPSNPLYGVVDASIQWFNSITLVDRYGNALNNDANDEVYVSSSNALCTKYQTVGMKVAYLKVNYAYGTDGANTATATVPVTIYVLDVKDYTYVLDYGLSANLTYDQLFGADILGVATVDTTHEVLGIASEDSVPWYNNYGGDTGNSIHFETVDNDSANGTWSITNNAKYDGDITVTPSARGDETFMTYKPTSFMEDKDDVYVAVSAHETKNWTDNGLGLTNIRKEVEMFKKVTFVPANVVYYEDDFPAITYSGTVSDATQSMENQFERVGSSADKTQSVDQEQEYGQDATYGDSANNQHSGGSLTTIRLEDFNTVASFDFKGTGFELIGRVNAVDAGVISVKVLNGTTVVKRLTVITEFDQHTQLEDGSNSVDDGGTEAINQVPIIRVDGLPFGVTYTVQISGIPHRDMSEAEGSWKGKFGITQDQYNAIVADGAVSDAELTALIEQEGITLTQDDITAMKGDDDAVSVDELKSALGMFMPSVLPTYLYVDGLRIFQPVGATNGAYTVPENGAQFVELRQLIVDGKAAVAEYDGNNMQVSTGTVTWTENRIGTVHSGGTFVGNVVSSVNDYLTHGPNNEVYMYGDTADSAVVFYVKKSGTGVHNLQVAVRAIDDSLFFGAAGNYQGMNAALHYGVTKKDANGDAVFAWKTLANLVSGTEQYYTVDIEDCPYDAEKDAYQVVLKIASGMVSYSSLKLNGLEIVDIKGEAATLYYENGLLKKEETSSEGGTGDTEVDATSYVNFNLLRNALSSAEIVDSNTTEVPDNGESGSTHLSHTYENGVCTICGKADPDYKAPKLNLVAPSLNFEDEIRYNVYFTAENIDDVVEMGLITFNERLEDGTIADAVSVVAGYTMAGEQYMVHTNGIPAKDLAKAVYFKAYAKLSDGTYVYSNVEGYHAVAYAKDILANSSSAEMKALVVAMLNYGAAAQKYFDSTVADSELMNAFLTADQQALVSAYSADMVADLTAVDGEKIGQFAPVSGGYSAMAPNVSFEGAFAINFYFTPAKTMDGELTLYYWTQDVYDGAETLTAENASGKVTMEAADGKYVAAVTGIAAKQIDQTIFVAGVYESDGVAYSTGVIAYSLASYCLDRAVNGSAAMQAFAKETIVYGYYAKAYFA